MSCRETRTYREKKDNNQNCVEGKEGKETLHFFLDSLSKKLWFKGEEFRKVLKCYKLKNLKAMELIVIEN